MKEEMNMKEETKRWTAFDTSWMLSLFGTAVGAGILFLPIRAGEGGFWPIIVMSFLIFPMTWLSHRGLSRFVHASNDPKGDLTHAAEEHFGEGVGLWVTILYFFAIYPICLAYGVGITNTIESFIVNQLGMQPFNRLVLAVILVSAMMFVAILDEGIVTKVCNALVYPLCIVLLSFSVYLIPHWQFDLLTEAPDFKTFLSVVWLTLPVLVFSFNHAPAISTFSIAMRRRYGQEAPEKASQVLFGTSAMLLFFVMFFVLSCVMCLDQQDFQVARASNLPILSYFANKLNNSLISYGGPLVALLAIVSSFFGHYFGAREGLNGIIRKAIEISGNKTPNLKMIGIFSASFIYVTMIFVAYLNPSILGFIEDLGGPIIAAILFLMPIYAIYRVKAMKKWKSLEFDLFVAITGILSISSIVAKFFL